MKLVTLIILSLLVFIVKPDLRAQSLPVGTTVLEDYYRRAQLSGLADTNVSYTVRPVFPRINKSKDFLGGDDTVYQHSMILNTRGLLQTNQVKPGIYILPATVQAQFNSTHPFGWNDGAMIPAKGLQTMLSAGIFAQYGLLTVQLRPEFVYAANPAFSTFNSATSQSIITSYYNIYNHIDLPVRFGTGSYQKAFWGQSSVRLNYKAFSVGLSTENLWWGPGIQNSLLMSNTAPGFPHLTLNTLRPVQTPIGSFEAQLIGGRLTNSGYPPLAGDDPSARGTDLNDAKPNDWRYLAGIVFTWQPKWVPGLFLGFDKASQVYGKSLSGIADYLPLFSTIRSTGTQTSTNSKDEVSSVFTRWLWTEEHAELYFEFGQYNDTQDLHQTLLQPADSRAYIFGIRKLLPFNKLRDENLLIGVEVTQLQENSVTNIRNGAEWYVSQAIPSGYTNMGQELGAGAGPGANLQTVDIDWVKGLKKIGLQFQRYVHNNDFYYYAFEPTGEYERHWVDLSMAAVWEWDYKNLMFNAKIQAVNSLDYQWNVKSDQIISGFNNGTTSYNLQLQAGVTYRF